jgi:SAM-dependent methyltransferase
MVTVGLAETDGSGRFWLTETGTLLCSESPGSMRITAQVLLAADHRRAWGRLADGVRTGQSPFVLEHGQKVFDYYAHHPEDRERFSRMMSNLTGAMEPGIVAAAPGLSRFHRICDLGSSRGTLLMGLLQRAPHAHGILFDLPDLANAARPLLAEHGWDARIDAVGGDFFQAVPAADLYTMKWILHDWSDEQSVQILRNIRHAAQPGASVWIIESTLPADDSPSFATLMDVNMLCMTDGQERTVPHYHRLLREAGFAPSTVTPVPGPIEVSIIEGTVN